MFDAVAPVVTVRPLYVSRGMSRRSSTISSVRASTAVDADVSGNVTWTFSSYEPTRMSVNCAAGVTPPVTKPKYRGPFCAVRQPGSTVSTR